MRISSPGGISFLSRSILKRMASIAKAGRENGAGCCSMSATISMLSKENFILMAEM